MSTLTGTRAGPSVTFRGAARSVTGSMHLLAARDHMILLDCGLVRGPRGHAHPPVGSALPDPRRLHAVVISHAHVDHCGMLGALVREGYRGPVYCTPATRDLLRLVLANSARIQEEDARVGRIVEGGPAPAFTHDDADRAVAQYVAVPYEQPLEILPGVELRLTDAGHILGSAMVLLTVRDGGRTGRITFTGDLGRRGALLLKPPASVPAADLIISESTYGGRDIPSPAEAAAAFEEVVRRTAERGGKVIVPAFSLGRTQVVAEVLQQAIDAGRVPALPVYVDGSMGEEMAEVHRQHFQNLGSATAARLAGGGPFPGSAVQYVRSLEESRELSARRGPCVLIAPSGMCEGGRILHHLKQHLDDPRSSVVLVNYQAPHTLGRRLLERGPFVRFHGQRWNKWADVVYLAGFSGHADHDDLMAALGPLVDQDPRVRLVHGEPKEAGALAAALHHQGFTDVAVPAREDTVALW